jgi:hypothetical protein
MIKRLLFLLAAVALVGPAAQPAVAKPKPKPKYYFNYNQKLVLVTTSVCKSIPSGTVTEKSYLTRTISITGYIGGKSTSRITEQVRLTRQGDNPHLPDYDTTAPAKEIKDEYDQTGDWKRRDGKIKFDPVWGYSSLTLKLPKVNKERTKSFTKTQQNTPPPSERCTYDESAEINGDLTIQRIQ